MPRTPQQDPSQTQWRKIVAEDDRTWHAYWRALKRRFRKTPHWTRYAGIAILLCFGITSLYLTSTTDPSRLQMICQHNFHAAQLIITVDGEEMFSGSLSTSGLTAKKRSAVLPRSTPAPESFSHFMDVPEGQHVVQVHISAPAEGFDQARSITADFVSGQENILAINATRHNAMTLSLKSPQVRPEAASRLLPKGGVTLLYSILGTMLSASVSFMVQEFWRTHKARITASQ